ncbi:PREDICTED: E3 ubiquitin-protein ligase RAD18 isoform X2 [Odobenus rosmarus divergens]|uniref:E3 ubiquitin-protein ligase RAD18 n=1 Tax=Odobenus rosmarus divergens TaxID=9708 RepID=A0A2U3VDS5_ODORO|nr:PREDICTED: E3 ubiquitin-protein ligase RAD18 isoform X2 [Odobenus rosmarus divergens]
MDSLVEPRWPPGLEVMKTIDDLLRCGICFEYFNIAMMIPQCSHNYCSLCIRKFLSYKTQCPTCCVTVTEPDLKNNRILDELVKSLNFARNHLLQFALESPPISPASSSSKNLASKVHTPVAFRHSLKQGSRLMENFLIRETGGSSSELLIKENESKCTPQKEVSTSSKTKETPIEKAAPCSLDAHVPETPSTSTLKQVTKVDCPVCGVNIPENHINKHLDSCLTREEKKESLRSSVHKRKPLPKTVYNLLSDRDLKKKLKQHGLSIQGNKQQLIKRHQEFVHMYNAQCDALHPKSAAEIVQEIENMEKTRMRLEASKLNEGVMVFTKDQTEKEIDEIHSKYQQEDKKMKFSDTSPVTNHFSQSKLESPGKMESDRPDDSSSCTDIQEEALSSSDSDSFKSSSSDIIRDILEEEEAWEASHRNDLQDTEMSPRQNRRTRSAEGAEIEPSNKRNRN